jgi:hypothetical protein
MRFHGHEQLALARQARRVALAVLVGILCSSTAMAQCGGGAVASPPNRADVISSGNGVVSLFWELDGWTSYLVSGPDSYAQVTSNSVTFTQATSGTYTIIGYYTDASGGPVCSSEYVAVQVSMVPSVPSTAPHLVYNPVNSTLNWSGGSGGNDVYFYVGNQPGQEVLAFQATPAQVAAQSVPFAPETTQYIQAAYTNSATFYQRSGEVAYESAVSAPAYLPALPGWAAIGLAVALILVATKPLRPLAILCRPVKRTSEFYA